MKRFSTGLICGILITLLMTGALASASSGMKLIVDGQEILCDVQPMVVDGRVMVPLRFVAEALGADATWDSELYAAIITSRPETFPEPVEPEPETDLQNSNTQEEVLLPEPEPIKEENSTPEEASVGQLIDFGQAKITVNGVSYSSRNGDYVAEDNQTFALVSMTVWTESDPPTGLCWAANHFASSVQTNDGKTITQAFCTGDSMQVIGGETKTVTLAYTIFSSDTLSEITIKNPYDDYNDRCVVRF